MQVQHPRARQQALWPTSGTSSLPGPWPWPPCVACSTARNHDRSGVSRNTQTRSDLTDT